MRQISNVKVERVGVRYVVTWDRVGVDTNASLEYRIVIEAEGGAPPDADVRIQQKGWRDE